VIDTGNASLYLLWSIPSFPYQYDILWSNDAGEYCQILSPNPFTRLHQMALPKFKITPQAELEPCMFPQLSKAFAAPDSRLSSSVAISFGPLQKFCRDHYISIESVLQTTWALVLRSYTGSEATLFGFQKLLATCSYELCADTFGIHDEVMKHLLPGASQWTVEEGEGEGLGSGHFNSMVVFCDRETNRTELSNLKKVRNIAVTLKY
jgi:hypothetical protein